jgi:hypothetical protein
MATREAACHCGQLRLEVDGDPFAVSICHCLACQRRTGSAFGMQAALIADRRSSTPNRRSRSSSSSPSGPSPTRRSRRRRSRDTTPAIITGSSCPTSIQRYAPELWNPARPLYEAGRYAEAADRGRELIEAHPEQAYLYYNAACCESLAGRTDDAIEHLRQAIDGWEGCRDLAKRDSDFDPIRGDPAFEELVRT